MKYLCKLKRVLIVVVISLVLFCIWKIVRVTGSVPDTLNQEILDVDYDKNEQAVTAISLCQLVYGCEGCRPLKGTVDEILNENVMGIFTENSMVVRSDQNDPTSALFDTTKFVKSQIGDYRFLIDLKDEKSGFYGAAFCDDDKKCIWITYSGTVSMSDALACLKLVFCPKLTSQEKSALELMDLVLKSDEVQKDKYSIILTGHSLGGALATITSFASNCPAVTINGADGIALDKISDIMGKNKSENRIINYMTSPNNGKLSVMDAVQRLMFLGTYKDVDYHVYKENGYTEDTHCFYSFITFAKDDYTEPLLP